VGSCSSYFASMSRASAAAHAHRAKRKPLLLACQASRGRTDRRGGRGAPVGAGHAGFAYTLVLVPVAVSVSSAFSGLKNTRSVTMPWTVSPGRSISSSTPSALWSTLTIA
jgi:hypothetical protein